MEDAGMSKVEPLMPKSNAWNRLVRQDGDKTPIEVLWDYFDGAFRLKWRSQFQDADAVRNWCRVWSQRLYEEGITFVMAKAALTTIERKMGANDFPPDLPTFIAAAKQIPSYEEAFIEAQRQIGQIDFGTDVWSHPAIYWAAVDFGLYDLRFAKWASSARRWTELLSKRLGQIDIQNVPKRLPKPEYKKGSPEVARAALDKIRESLGMRSAD